MPVLLPLRLNTFAICMSSSNSETEVVTATSRSATGLSRYSRILGIHS